jgi:hypothetical protein
MTSIAEGPARDVSGSDSGSNSGRSDRVGGGGFDDWLFDRIIRRAEEAGFEVPAVTRRALRDVLVDAIVRSVERHTPPDEITSAVDVLADGLIRATQSRAESTVGLEALEAAFRSLCPIWPIC